jgi:plastocyanin
MRIAVAGILAVVSLLAAGCGSGGGGGGTTAAGSGEGISLNESEFKIDPAAVNVDQSGTVTLHITNNGQVDHAFEIEGQGIEEQKTDTIKPGESADLTVELSKTGEYEFYCPIDGHRDKGMEGTLIVGGAGASGGTGGATTGEQEGTTGGGGYGYGSG